jgi:hypothetical protein
LGDFTGTSLTSGRLSLAMMISSPAMARRVRSESWALASAMLY